MGRILDANQRLNGSAFGDGMDWIIRSNPFVSVQSVLYLLPSADSNFSCTMISYNWSKPSLVSFLLRSLQYLLGLLLSESISITSIMEKYHFSSSVLYRVLIFLS